MSFESKAQRRWMHANEPEMAERWEREMPKGKRLPERKRKVLGSRNPQKDGKAAKEPRAAKERKTAKEQKKPERKRMRGGRPMTRMEQTVAEL